MLIKRSDQFIAKYNFVESQGTLHKYKNDIWRSIQPTLKSYWIDEAYFQKTSEELWIELWLAGIILIFLFRDVSYSYSHSVAKTLIQNLIYQYSDFKFLLEYYIFNAVNFRNDVFILVWDWWFIEIVDWNELKQNKSKLSSTKGLRKFYLNHYLNIVYNWAIASWIDNEYLTDFSFQKVLELVERLWLRQYTAKKDGKFWKIKGSRVWSKDDLRKTWVEDEAFLFWKIGYEFRDGKKWQTFQEFSIKIDEKWNFIKDYS